MDLYTIQQILERCDTDDCRNILKIFEMNDDDKTIRMKIYERYVWRSNRKLLVRGISTRNLFKQPLLFTQVWIDWVYRCATMTGNLEFMKYARENGAY